MEPVEEAATLEFRWLKKRGVGGKKKEVQFYESFVYEGVEYALYDCVYMYKEGLPEPYIGKLIKIWETADKTKKVKVQWFFRPGEISNWLGDTKTLENEILLACGDGVGLANINPLEAIAGQCNVVCVSKDCRNPQPSDEELEAADYIFYRTFDVQSCTILDKMGDTVGGLDIKYIFNRKGGENTSIATKCSSDRKEESSNAVASGESQQLLAKTSTGELKTIEDGNDNQSTVEADEKGESQAKDVQKLLIRSEAPSAGVSRSGAGWDSSTVTETYSERGGTDRCTIKSDNDKLKLSEVSLKRVEAKVKSKIPTGSNMLKNVPQSKGEVNDDETILVPVSKVESKKRGSIPTDLSKQQDGPFKKYKPDDNRPPQEKQVALNSDRSKGLPSKKSKVDNSMKSPIESELEHEEMSPLHDDNLKTSVSSGSIEEKPNEKVGKVLKSDKEMVSAKVKADLEFVTRKERAASPGSDNKDSNSSRNFNSNKSGDSRKDLVTVAEKKQKSGLDFPATDKEPKRELPGERKRKLSMIKSPKVSNLLSNKDKKITYQEFVVSPKPVDEKKAWFKLRPWDERLQNAYGLGAAALLHNLDPDYTSADVEDIIWHALSEHCEAKMIQRTSISSPHYGQALILFKTKETAQRVLKTLDDECLMLSNGRPLVATACPPILSNKKHSKFFGHLSIDKSKTQKILDMDEAVSTSHYSQPNTIEYDMAIEWILLQKRSHKWWNMMHKQQGDEMRKLEANLKRKK